MIDFTLSPEIEDLRLRTRAFIEEHVSGHRDHGYRLYTLLMLELWHREFIDR